MWPDNNWLVTANIAGLGLGVLFLIGGPLVQFTGNESVAPLFAQATELGVGGLLLIVLIKIVVIAWSLAMGYRGGLVFPFILVASGVVAIGTLYNADLNVLLAVFIFLAGLLKADRKANLITGHTVE